MTLRGNRGEWSEVYCLLDLLTEGYVPVHDDALDAQKGALQVEAVYRYAGSERVEYMRKDVAGSEEAQIRIWQPASGITSVVSLTDVRAWRDELRAAITRTDATGGAFEIESLAPAFESLQIKNLTSSGSRKADLAIEVRSLGITSTTTLTLSIKSHVGSAPTLMNASGATGIDFLIRNAPLDSADVQRLNDVSNSRALAELLSQGAEIEILGFANPVFRDNLRMLDSDMDEIWARVLIESHLGSKHVSEISQRVAGRLKQEYGESADKFVRAKMERLLEAAALGMRPSIPWDGQFTVDGGYLVVEPSGQLKALLNKNMNQLRQYLFVNTALDYPSKTRNGFGTFTESQDALVVRLNAQIRFHRSLA